ncbi:MAG: disulfide bond formation protein B [Rickettsia sp.]|nr:disulfide bond formation protein B [Rickettsia sp.]
MFCIIYVLEFILGWEVCSICIYERFFHLIILYFLSKVCFRYFFTNKLISKKLISNFLKDIMKYNILIICTIFCSILLSSYHLALEKGILKNSALCSSDTKINFQKTSIESYMKSGTNGKTIPCDKINKTIWNFSLTELNLLFSFFLFLTFLILNFNIYVKCFFPELFYRRIYMKELFKM